MEWYRPPTRGRTVLVEVFSLKLAIACLQYFQEWFWICSVQCKWAISPSTSCGSTTVVNPRRACAERVTVVVSSVCMYVCMYVCPNTLFWQYAQLKV